MKNTRSIYLLLSILILHPVFGQVIPFDNYFGPDGLPANSINDIEQDQSGYLWLATQEGAAKFDGYTFQTFTTSDGLPDNAINDIFIDSRDRIWFATDIGGIAVINKNKVRVINQSQGLVSNYSKKIFEDRNGNIWYTSREGVSIILPDTIVSYRDIEGELVGEIYATYVAFDSSVWFSTIDKVFCYRDKLEIFKLNDLNNVLVRTISEDSKGSYWFGTQQKGIIHFSGSKTTVFNSLNGLGSDIVLALTPIKKGEILAGLTYPGGISRIIDDQIVEKWTSGLQDYAILDIHRDLKDRVWARTYDKGLLLVEKGKLTKITDENNLCHNKPSKIFEDRNGNIWISTENGLSKYGKIIFEIYDKNLIDDDKIIYSIAAKSNKVYLGTLSGLNILENNKVFHAFDRSVAPESYPDVLSILPLKDNEVWLGTYVGLTQLKNTGINFLSDSVFYPDENNITYATDLEFIDNSIYCATSLGLVKYKNHEYSLYTEENGLIHNYIWSLKADKQKNIWCATVKGLSIFDGEIFHNYDTTSGLPHNYCHDIAFDNKGYGYIATENGISKVKLHSNWTISCKNFGKKDGLGAEGILSVIVDKKDDVWVGHTKGINKIDFSTGKISGYGALEGFLPVESNSGAVALGQGNDIWFGTMGGAVRYIPDNDIIDQNPPQVHITSIELIGSEGSLIDHADSIDQSTLLPMGLKLKYNKNTLQFKFVGIHYTIIEKNRYRYMLEGFLDSWSDPSTETEALYRRIPPGKYKFKVLASNCDGVWSPEPAVFEFEIKPPFWNTWWFHTFEALAAIGIIILIIRYRERKLRHDREVLAQKVKERTIEIAKQRDQIAQQKEEITDSILYAERIQSAVLPNTDYINRWLRDYFILFKPRDIVSGDFYWLNGNRDRVMVVASDCTGHGVPGAFMSMLGVSILNEIATETRDIPAGEILDLLREHLTSTLWQTGDEKDAKDGMDMVLGIFDFKKLKLQFAAAYNPLVLIRSGEIIVHKGDRMPVGYHPEQMPSFKTQALNLKKGDCIYMFSDGYADQFGGLEGKKFKSANFRNLLLEINQLPMNEQKDILNETIIDWMGINEQVDDILVIGIRI